MNCRATLTTVTTTDDVVATFFDETAITVDRDIPDGVAVVRDGDRLMRLHITTLTCAYPGPSCISDGAKVGVHESANGEVWSDDTKGAASHADNTPPAEPVLCGHLNDPPKLIYSNPHGCSCHGDCPGPHTTPADVKYERYCNKCGYIGPDERHDGCPYSAWETDVPADVCPATRSGDACIKAAGHDGLHAYKADVCDNPDCENGIVTRAVEGIGSAVPFPCPSCGGTGDRPDTDDHAFTPKEQGGPYCDVCDWHRDTHRPAVTDADSISEALHQAHGVPACSSACIHRFDPTWTLLGAANVATRALSRPAITDDDGPNEPVGQVDSTPTTLGEKPPPADVCPCRCDSAGRCSDQCLVCGTGDRPAVSCGACWGDYGEHDPRCERHPRNISRDRPAVTAEQVDAILDEVMALSIKEQRARFGYDADVEPHTGEMWVRAALEAVATRPAPAVTDAEEDAATEALLPLLTSWSAKQRREVARAALKAAREVEQ